MYCQIKKDNSYIMPDIAPVIDRQIRSAVYSRVNPCIGRSRFHSKTREAEEKQMKNSDCWEGQGGEAKTESEKEEKQTVCLLLSANCEV